MENVIWLTKKLRLVEFGPLASCFFMLDAMSSLSTMKASSECSKGVAMRMATAMPVGTWRWQTENSSWLLAVITSRWVNQRQFPHNVVGNQEALETCAPVSQLVHLV